MAYQYLSPEDQAEIVNQVRRMMPTPDAGQRDRERSHFRAIMLAKAGAGEMPDDLGPDESPDVAVRAAFHAALDLEIAKLPPEVQTAITSIAESMEVLG